MKPRGRTPPAGPGRALEMHAGANGMGSPAGGIPGARANGPIRIAMLVTRMDIGGVPDHVMTLLDGLDGRFEVTLICSDVDPRHGAQLRRLSIPVMPLAMKRLPGPIGDLKAFVALRRILREGRYDILHTHMSKAALLGALAGATMQKIRVVNTAHNLGFIAMPQPWKKAVFWIYDRLISSVGIDATITVSSIVGNRAKRARLIPARRLHVIRNGIREGRFDPHAKSASASREMLGIGGNGEKLILCVARLVWFKGLQTLLAAMPSIAQEHPGARLVIVGEGELREKLEQQIEQLNMQRHVMLAGERTDIPDLLAACDLFVLPSVSEGLPISILEAMAAARPVVATSVGGIPELVADGQSGRLVAPGRPDELARAMSDLLGDPKLRAQMGAAGHARFRSMFSQQAMVESTQDLYRALVQGRRRERMRHV